MTIIVEQALDCSTEDAWQALTVTELMRQWFFSEMPDFEASVDFEVRFDVKAKSQVFDHVWKVLEVNPGKSMLVNWKYPPHKGEGLVKFEVAPQNNNSLVRVTCDGIDSFPQDVPEFTPESCRSSWEYFLQGRLAIFINETES